MNSISANATLAWIRSVIATPAVCIAFQPSSVDALFSLPALQSAYQHVEAGQCDADALAWLESVPEHSMNHMTVLLDCGAALDQLATSCADLNAASLMLQRRLRRLMFACPLLVLFWHESDVRMDAFTPYLDRMPMSACHVPEFDIGASQKLIALLPISLLPFERTIQHSKIRPTAFEHVPAPAAGTLFSWCIQQATVNSDINARFTALLNSFTQTLPSLRQSVVNVIADSMAASLDDDQIYVKLRELVEAHGAGPHALRLRTLPPWFPSSVELSALLPAAIGHPPTYVLDLGCVDAMRAHELRETMNTYVRANLRPEDIIAYDNVNFDQDALPFPDGQFHVVVATMSLHHSADPQRLISEIARVLVMGGTLLLREHDSGGRVELSPLFDLWHGLHAKVFGEELQPQRQMCRSNYMSRMQWLEALAKVGLNQDPYSPDSDRLYRNVVRLSNDTASIASSVSITSAQLDSFRSAAAAPLPSWCSNPFCVYDGVYRRCEAPAGQKEDERESAGAADRTSMVGHKRGRDEEYVRAPPPAPVAVIRPDELIVSRCRASSGVVQAHFQQFGQVSRVVFNRQSGHYTVVFADPASVALAMTSVDMNSQALVGDQLVYVAVPQGKRDFIFPDVPPAIKSQLNFDESKFFMDQRTADRLTDLLRTVIVDVSSKAVLEQSLAFHSDVFLPTFALPGAKEPGKSTLLPFSVTDATAQSAGSGQILSFVQAFTETTALLQHGEALRHNAAVLQVDDCMRIEECIGAANVLLDSDIPTVQQDILYCDPWDGRQSTKGWPRLQQTDLFDVIMSLYTTRTRLICVRVAKNAGFEAEELMSRLQPVRDANICCHLFKVAIDSICSLLLVYFTRTPKPTEERSLLAICDSINKWRAHNNLLDVHVYSRSTGKCMQLPRSQVDRWIHERALDTPAILAAPAPAPAPTATMSTLAVPVQSTPPRQVSPAQAKSRSASPRPAVAQDDDLQLTDAQRATFQRASADLPAGWTCSWSTTHNRPFFFHEATGKSDWSKPKPQ